MTGTVNDNTATITVQVMDNGGTANNGVNVRTRNFVVTVSSGPDAPLAVDDDLPLVPTILREGGSREEERANNEEDANYWKRRRTEILEQLNKDLRTALKNGH